MSEWIDKLSAIAAKSIAPYVEQTLQEALPCPAILNATPFRREATRDVITAQVTAIVFPSHVQLVAMRLRGFDREGRLRVCDLPSSMKIPPGAEKWCYQYRIAVEITGPDEVRNGGDVAAVLNLVKIRFQEAEMKLRDYIEERIPHLDGLRDEVRVIREAAQKEIA